MKKNNFFHREEKEKWVRSKYELKEFVPSPPYLDVPLPQVFTCFVASCAVILMILQLSPDLQCTFVFSFKGNA